MRLSRDDEKAGESASIEHQRTLLQNYVAERKGNIIDEYVDDGWSGTNFDRPEVKRMLEDARSGKINTIIVKDLSRFGRNYIQIGQYIDYIFPAYGIRFIAINDNLDTADRSSAAMDMMPIMNVFNEWHAANTSKKIRAVLDSSRRSGKFTNWSYPYGYKAGSDENRTAVIDVRAAAVVRRIFDLRLQGYSARSIAITLTDEGIPNPATYFTRLDGKKSDRRCSPYWAAKTVAGILSNPVYLGNTVQRKTTSVSYKNHKVVKIPQSEWIIKENAHKAIISREVWDGVQALNKSEPRGRADKCDTVHALSGMLICADCGKKMKLKTCACKSGSAGKRSFVCRTYTDLGKKYCSSHNISETEIESIVLTDIQSMLKSVTLDCDKAKERFLKERARNGAGGEEYKKRLKACNKRLSELDKLVRSAFEEKVLGNIPESVCDGMVRDYLNEKNSVQNEINKINKLLEAPDDGECAENYVRRLKAYSVCEKLTRETCLELIEFILVGEKKKTTVRAIFRFITNSRKP